MLLVCVELTNFEYSHNLFLISFQSTKLRQPTEGRDSCLKINKYNVIFVNSTIRHIPNNFSYEKPGTLYSSQKNWKDSINIRHWKMTSKIRIFRCSRMLFIILVSLTVTSFSEKMLISNINSDRLTTCICLG